MKKHNDHATKKERKAKEMARREMRQRPRGKAWEM